MTWCISAQHIPMASYPTERMYDAYGKPLGPSDYPHPGYSAAPQYPGMPPQYPMMQPGPYPPYPMVDPTYGQGKMSIASSLLKWCIIQYNLYRFHGILQL